MTPRVDRETIDQRYSADLTTSEKTRLTAPYDDTNATTREEFYV